MRILSDRRGGVASIAAISAGLLCLIAAMVIDGGSIVLTARRVQGAADLAALSAARDLPHAPAAARATVTANLGPAAELIEAETGRYLADPAKPPAERFGTLRGADANAARVRVRGQARLWFAGLLLGRESLPVERSAVAAVRAGRPMAMLSIGSRLARLEGGLANQVLSGLTGSSVSLTAMDYNALADADVSLLGFSEALATEAGVELAGGEGWVDQSIDAGDALRALESVSDGADAALGGLARAADGRSVTLGDLIGLEAGAPEALRGGLDVRLSALDLAGAVLEVANGERQVALDAGARAGLADVDVWLAVGERPNRSPWLTVTGEGEPIVRTAQARIYIEARTTQAAAGLAQVRLPILIELAAAEGRLEAIECAPDRRVRLGARPGVARARIARIDRARLADFKAPLAVGPATLVDVAGLVRVSGQADMEAADAGFTSLNFSEAEIASQAVKTVGSRGFASNAVSTLIGRLKLDVQVAGLGLGLGGLSSAIGQVLRPVGPVLDGVVNGVLSPLGLSLGEADLVVHNATCPEQSRTPVLVG